jgi:hypothetical protein
MATYAELLAAAGNSTLMDKMRVAVIIAADKVRAEDVATPLHAERMLWAKSVFQNPTDAAKSMMWSVLAQNASASSAAILSASDATVQTNVDACVSLFANGMA